MAGNQPVALEFKSSVALSAMHASSTSQLLIFGALMQANQYTDKAGKELVTKDVWMIKERERKTLCRCTETRLASDRFNIVQRRVAERAWGTEVVPAFLGHVPCLLVAAGEGTGRVGKAGRWQNPLFSAVPPT